MYPRLKAAIPLPDDPDRSTHLAETGHSVKGRLEPEIPTSASPRQVEGEDAPVAGNVETPGGDKDGGEVA